MAAAPYNLACAIGALPLRMERNRKEQEMGNETRRILLVEDEKTIRDAVAAYLENAGFGGTWAAPIASLLVEQYLNGETSRPQLEESIMQSNLMMNVPVKR